MTAVRTVDAALIAANAILVFLWIGQQTRRPATAGAAFWPVLRLAQSLAVAEVVVVAVLYELGDRPGDRLFYLYAILPVAINLFGEELRAQALHAVLAELQLASPAEIASLPAERRRAVSRAVMSRQLGVTALVAVVVIALTLRALSTSGGI